MVSAWSFTLPIGSAMIRIDLSSSSWCARSTGPIASPAVKLWSPSSCTNPSCSQHHRVGRLSDCEMPNVESLAFALGHARHGCP